MVIRLFTNATDIAMNSITSFLNKWKKLVLKATGVNPDTNLVEIVELKDHPWFIGVQYHPELKSTVLNPHPLFVKFVEAAMNR
jgi:CTP synthase